MMIFIKYLVFTLITYIILFATTFSMYYDKIKNDIVSNEKTIKLLVVSEFEAKIKNDILHNNYNDIKLKLNKLRETSIFNNVKLEYTNLYITRDSILNHSNNVTTKDWILNDIAIDVKYGELIKQNDSLFLYVKNEINDFGNTLEVKFQALNDTGMKNSTSTISYNLPKFEELIKEEVSSFAEIKLRENLFLKEETITKTFFTNDKKEFAKIYYYFNNNYEYKKLSVLLHKAFIYFNALFFILLFLTILFHIYLLQNLFLTHLKELEKYVKDILNNKFYKYEYEKLNYKNMISIGKSASLISRKLATVMNELNVNRGTIELQVSTDSLTKLPNYKIFEHDMKALFLTDIHSYIITLRLDHLQEYAKNNSQDKTDKFILMFANIIKSSINEFDGKHITLYRLYGSGFVLIAKYIEYKKVNKLLKHTIKELSILNKSLKIEEKIVHGIALPFDHYSTTDKHLKDLDELYINTVNESKENSYYTLDSKSVDEEDSKLEKTVNSIITNDAFSLSYKFDTYLFSDPNKLMMQEVSANLINTDGSVIPIGTFISVAEHINIAIEFDKKLIIKTFQYIKQNQIEHILAINISISSLKDPDFVTWLESLLTYDYKSIIDNIVFSVTTFAVKNNFETFATFTNEIHKFNGKIILKRFSYNDLSLEQLEILDLDYIRVHKDYTKDINKERKAILKNIINFSIIHDIDILGDMVSNENDYTVLEALKFYATSK